MSRVWVNDRPGLVEISIQTSVPAHFCFSANLHQTAPNIHHKLASSNTSNINMTLYFGHFRIRNPLKPSHKGFLEGVLAAEAAEKEKAENTAKKAEVGRVMILLR